MKHDAFPPESGHLSGQTSISSYDSSEAKDPPPSRVRRKRAPARAASRTSADLPESPFSLLEMLLIFR